MPKEGYLQSLKILAAYQKADVFLSSPALRAGDSAGLWKSGFTVSGTGHFPTALGQLLGKPRTCPHCPQHGDYYYVASWLLLRVSKPGVAEESAPSDFKKLTTPSICCSGPELVCASIQASDPQAESHGTGRCGFPDRVRRSAPGPFFLAK